MFIVQVNEKGIPTTDMGFILIDACKYQNWYNKGKKPNNEITVETVNPNGEINTLFGDTMAIKVGKSFIPVGTLEFVEEYMRKEFGVPHIKPINIPPEIANQSRFVKRNMRIASNKEIEDSITNRQCKELFIKSTTKCKGYTSVVDISNIKEIPYDLYLISEVIDLKSEWRAFVFRGKVVDVRLYSGNWSDRFDIEFINDAVATYKSCPPAYTLDIGLTENNEMVIIEVHNLISCGLYGFEDYRILPQMARSAFKYEVKYR